MHLVKRNKSTNGNQDSTNLDGGDSLSATASSSAGDGGKVLAAPIISPRRSIRDYADSTGAAATKPYEDSYLLYKGRKSYLMVPISKALTWITKLSIHYHHKQYLSYRLIIYFVVILIAGLIKDFLLTSPPSPLPTSVIDWIDTNLKTSKRNFLNVYFVKWGWLWTFIALIPFFIFTRYYAVKQAYEREQRKYLASQGPKRKKSVHFREPLEDFQQVNDSNDANKSNVNDENVENKTTESTDGSGGNGLKTKSLKLLNAFGFAFLPTIIRLAIATAIWFYSVQFFVYYADLKGHCQSSNSSIIDSVTNKHECAKQQGKWHLGFDISGHIFLMTYSNLIRIEELYFLLKKFDVFAEFRYLSLTRSRSMNYATPYRFSFSLFHLFALLIIAIGVMVTLVWDFMIVQTSFFYHTWDQKIAGFVWALLAWAITYRAAFTLPPLRLQVAPA